MQLPQPHTQCSDIMLTGLHRLAMLSADHLQCTLIHQHRQPMQPLLTFISELLLKSVKSEAVDD
ncbi:MAG: hypothetical protein CVV16_02375 [Gammaproteobacteria bacterium HGW-Gammaproteobacteria-6]|nr:MAG: hypothetical protein CVV16_02375 [Gammaproteobacteria bacterium HGW-Gammaproteobacteria-6]